MLFGRRIDEEEREFRRNLALAALGGVGLTAIIASFGKPLEDRKFVFGLGDAKPNSNAIVPLRGNGGPNALPPSGGSVVVHVKQTGMFKPT